jgi:MinD superfamily P-loop ATPase
MKIAIASGKGGTGKTTIATSLALSLQNSHLIDADVEEPNCSLFLGMSNEIVGDATISFPVIDENKCTLCGICSSNCEFNALACLKDKILVFEKVCHGCGLCKTLCPYNAISEKNRKIGKIYRGLDSNLLFNYGELEIGEELSSIVIAELKKYASNNHTNIIIDAPPGSGCPVVETVIDVDFVVVVGEPTPFGLSDMQHLIEMLKHLGKKFGVIVNKAGIGNDDLLEYCKEEKIQILMKIPFSLEIAKQYSKGITLVNYLPDYKDQFIQMFSKIESLI